MISTFSYCTVSSDEKSVATTAPSDTVSDSSEAGNVLQETDLYKLIHNPDDSTYTYLIYDKNGNVVKKESGLSKEPYLSVTDNNLVKFTLQSGTGIGTLNGYYYDVDNNRFSDVITGILDESNGMVACGDWQKVTVRDIFDKDGYCLEIAEFENPLSSVSESISDPIISAVFSDDGKSITVTYYSGETAEKAEDVIVITK